MRDEFRDKLLALIDYYLSKGCPCRFPRFRAVVSRDTSGVAGGAFTSDEQWMLIGAFEHKVPLVNRRPLEGWGGPIRDDMYDADCGICGSEVSRSSNEYAPGAWVQYLVIRLAPGVTDIAAPVEGGKVFRPRPLVGAGPGMTGMAKATQAYPFTDEDQWFAWMRELKDAKSSGRQPVDS